MEELTKRYANNTKEIQHLLQAQHLKMLSIQSRDSTWGGPRIYILIFPLGGELTHFRGNCRGVSISSFLLQVAMGNYSSVVPNLLYQPKASGISVITGKILTQTKGVIYHGNTT